MAKRNTTKSRRTKPRSGAEICQGIIADAGDCQGFRIEMLVDIVETAITRGGHDDDQDIAGILWRQVWKCFGLVEYEHIPALPKGHKASMVAAYALEQVREVAEKSTHKGVAIEVDRIWNKDGDLLLVLDRIRDQLGMHS